MASQAPSLKRKAIHVSIKQEHIQSAAKAKGVSVSNTESAELISHHAKKAKTSHEKYNLGVNGDLSISLKDCEADEGYQVQKQKKRVHFPPTSSQTTSEDEDSLKAYLEASHSPDLSTSTIAEMDRQLQEDNNLATSAIAELDRQLEEEQNDILQFNEELTRQRQKPEVGLSGTSKASNAQRDATIVIESSCTVQFTNDEEEHRRRYMSKQAELVEKAHNAIIRKEQLTRQVESLAAKKEQLEDEIEALQEAIVDCHEDLLDANGEYFCRHI